MKYFEFKKRRDRTQPDLAVSARWNCNPSVNQYSKNVRMRTYQMVLKREVTFALAGFVLSGCAIMPQSLRDAATDVGNGYSRMTDLYPETTEIKKISCFTPPLEEEKKECAPCETKLDKLELDPIVGTDDNTCATPAALRCAEDTRMVNEDFLMCREKRQLIAGVGIALLAAGAGGAAVAGSTIAGGVVGSVAGAGLGLDFATYNSSKTSAFATAATQLDCIVRQTLPVRAALGNIDSRLTKFKSAVKDLKGCADAAEASATKLYLAEETIAESQESYAAEQLNPFGLNVYAAIRSTQVTAFAGSQNGIPTPSQFQQAIQSMSLSLPTPTLPSGFGAAIGTCKEPLKEAEANAITFRAALASFQLPDPLYQQCLSVSSSVGGGGNGSPNGSSKTGGGGNQGGGNQGGGNQGGGNQGGNQGGQNANSNNLSGAPAPLSVQPVTNGNLCIYIPDKIPDKPDKHPDGGATLQVSGGTPPYYFIAVDDGITVSAPEVRLDRDSPGGRVVVADQGGSQQVIYAIPTNTPCATPTPAAGPGH